ncbi:MAG: molybdate ABC transporter substrate-binding protein [Steroidobacteraceae bacterium]
MAIPIRALLLCAVLCAGPAAAETVPPRVYAAASLAESLDEVAARWQQLGHVRPLLVFGGSGALARQLQAGAPADVFVAADVEWMDRVAAAGRLQPGSRVDLLGNSLVLVAPRGAPVHVELRRGFDLAAAFKGRLCLGEPNSVPAGRYGREALAALGLWDSVEARVVPTEDVRATLAFVERGACALGIVYASDALEHRDATVVARFDAASHRAIVYPAALLSGATPEARAFFAFLRGPAARRAFERHGFSVRGDSPR